MRIADDFRELRLDAGVSLREVAEATGIDPSHLARIEKGRVQASLPTLTTLSIALGATLSLRVYADAGPRIHDRHQAPMIEGLIRSLHDDWIPRLEVAIPGDRRGVADIVLKHRTQRTLVIGEAQSQFRRIEQQLRWIQEKASAFESGPGAGERVSKLLILRSTAATRVIARTFQSTLSTAYPARSIDVFDALTRGSPWPGDGIVWMRVDEGLAELLPRPPRGVALGR
jgi:transcriptional regulator with XRE-family HTH domain